MAQRITVNDLVNEVRGQTDEQNREAVTDEGDIIPALNRAQNYATDVLARFYKEPLLTSVMVPTVAGGTLYDIPEDAFEGRLLAVEVYTNATYFPVKAIDFADIGIYEYTNAQTSIPYYYSVVGNQFKVLPNSTGAYPLRLWYLKDPMPLVKSQGRINIVNAAANYLIVDALGEEITAEADELTSFVNLIDGATGIVKGTMQVQAINGNKVTFKTVPTRTEVLDIPVDTDMADLASELTVEQDDYICLAEGTCVPFMKKPLSNFLVQYAVAEINRKLGGADAMNEDQVLEKFEKQVERTWANRPNTMRVKKRNARWNFFPVRYPRSTP